MLIIMTESAEFSLTDKNHMPFVPLRMEAEEFDHDIQNWRRKLLRDRSHWNMSTEARFNAVLHSDQWPNLGTLMISMGTRWAQKLRHTCRDM